MALTISPGRWGKTIPNTYIHGSALSKRPFSLFWIYLETVGSWVWGGKLCAERSSWWQRLLCIYSLKLDSFHQCFPLFHPYILANAHINLEECMANLAQKSACAPLCRKNMCCASRFCTGGVVGGSSTSEQVSKGPWSKMLAQGHNLRLRDEGGSRGGGSTKNPKTRTVSTCRINTGGLSLKKIFLEFRIRHTIAKTWCVAKKGLFISCTQGGL